MKNRCNKKAESQRDIILDTMIVFRAMNSLDITLAAILIVLEKHFGFNVKCQVISGAK